MADKKKEQLKSSSINAEIDEQLFGSKGKQTQQTYTATQAKVFSTIAKVRDNLSSDGIEDSVNDSTNLIRVINTEDERLNKASKSEDIETKTNLVKQLDTAATSISREMDITSLFSGEESRLQNYALFEQITEYIVQVMEAVDTYTDNILSPDSFNNTSLPIVLENDITDEDLRNRIYSRTKAINDNYNIYPKIENAIKKSLYLGDYFIVTLNLNRRISELLSEETSEEDNEKQLTPNNVLKVINQIEARESLNEDFNLAETFTDVINENGENIHVTDTLLAEGVSDYVNSLCVINEDSSEIVKSLKNKESIYNNDIASKMAKRKGKSKQAEKIKFNKNLGSLVKEYHPKDVIKLTDGNITFGYLLVDYINTTYDQVTAKASNSIFKNMTDTFSRDEKTSATQKYLDIITRSIIQKVKLNPKIISDNTELADIFYNIIRRSKNEGKQFTVTFAYPNEVHHFKPTNDIYGISILEKIKFFAKLYIGVLTNAFMSNAIRKNERLAYYIDVTGNDNDVFNSVNDLVRTIKQREIKFSNINSISSVLNSAGEFHDFFIPTAGGNRPIDIEPISLGQPKEIDTPFIEFLKKQIITGSGVPASFINSMEEIEFARSISMDNGKFLRRIIRMQGIYSPTATGVIREIYENEYDIGEVNPKDKKKDIDNRSDKTKVSIEEQLSTLPSSIISIKFPVPVTLSIRVQEEQLQTANSQVETLTDIEIGDENMALRYEFRRLLMRKLIPSVDWEEIDRVRKEAEKLVAIKQGAKDPEDSENNATSSGFGRQW